MQDYEKLGVFYLGKEYDLEARQPKDHLILYSSKDLLTHAVVLGMTGSGKTGLCIGLIEEAALDGVPSILIDPKGDLCNLLLTFPNLSAAEFLPWINQDDARQKNLLPQEYSARQAKAWAEGLQSWGQDGARIERLRDSADFRIYTPASSAGFPVSILKSFAAPDPQLLDDAEAMRERISAAVTSLLGLLGVEADPLQSREFILLSTIMDTMWRQGRDLDLAQLITLVQDPPVNRIGVLDLESVYPSKDRFTLVMALNNLLASPGFNAWLEGEPLDIGSILYTSQGKPRVAIFSIAHLNDAQRMFFVSLLLNQVLGWMRTQPGTTSLRAILYIDEIFGFLPPIGNPPSKTPLLTLLKQARAFGLGLVLATQNPADLDYKALSNAGTWLIGRLQTERDKNRVLEGLEGASAVTGQLYNRRDFDRILSGLGSRVFLLNNAHEDEPVVMTTRWALSYLPGPLTREQIRSLMAPVKAAAQPIPLLSESIPAVPTATASAAGRAVPAAIAADAQEQASTDIPPTLPNEIPQYYLPVQSPTPEGCALVYQPRIIAAARVSFADTKSQITTVRTCQYLAEITGEVVPVVWENASPIELPLNSLEQRPGKNARFAPLPAPAGKVKNYPAWARDFAAWLHSTQALELLYNPNLKTYSQPGENECDFRVRLAQVSRERRDDAVDILRKKYAPKINTIQERLRKAQAGLELQKDQAQAANIQAAISIGATLLGAFGGRKRGVSGATTAARGVGRSMSEREDIARAEDALEVLQKQLADQKAEFEAETAHLAARIDPSTAELQIVTVKPRKADISIQMVALVWAPFWQDEQGNMEAGF